VVGSIFVILWFALILIVSIICLLKTVNKEDRIKNSFITLAMLMVLLSAIQSYTPTFKNGGMAFLKEKNSEPLVCQGTIESITESSELISHHHGFGSDIVIGGVTYIAAEEGDFKVGDKVVVRYLENSKFVLEINRIEE
jgi:hypothetical protein